MMIDKKQSGHVHLFVVAVIVVAAIAAVGAYVYQQQHKPSKITDAAIRTQLQQTAADIKKLDLGDLTKSANTLSSAQSNFNYKKANDQ